MEAIKHKNNKVNKIIKIIAPILINREFLDKDKGMTIVNITQIINNNQVIMKLIIWWIKNNKLERDPNFRINKINHNLLKINKMVKIKHFLWIFRDFLRFLKFYRYFFRNFGICYKKFKFLEEFERLMQMKK